MNLRSRVAGIRRCSARRALFWSQSVDALGKYLYECTGGQQKLVVASYLRATDQRYQQHGKEVNKNNAREAFDDIDCDSESYYPSCVHVFRSLLRAISDSGKLKHIWRNITHLYLIFRY